MKENEHLLSSKLLSRHLIRGSPKNFEVGLSAEFRKCKPEVVPFGPVGPVCRRRCCNVVCGNVSCVGQTRRCSGSDATRFIDEWPRKS